MRPTVIVLLSLLMLSALPASVAAQTGDSSGSLTNPDISLIMDVAAAWFSEDSLQTGAHDPSETGFNLQQLELHLESNVDPFFKLAANIVFSPHGVELEEAFATTLALPGNLQMRGGKFLERFGRINPTHPHQWSFVDQPVAIGRYLGEEGASGIGVEISWLAPLPWYVEFIGSVVYPGEHHHDDEEEVVLEEEEVEEEEGQKFRFLTSVRQFFPLSRDWALYWGVSALLVPENHHGKHVEILGSDLTLRYRPRGAASRTQVSLEAEGLYRTGEGDADRTDDWGGYAQLVWLINPNWEVGTRYDWLSDCVDEHLEPVFQGGRQRVSVQGTFYPSHFSRVRLQGSYDAPEATSEPIWATLLSFEFLIGAHGAHSY